MSVSLHQLDQAEPPEIATTLRNAGVAGAGGAGFPTHAKWERLDDAPFLLVNHQESEPNYYMDKWLGKTEAETYASFFDALLDRTFELIVVCGKAKERDRWMGDLEAATDATVYTPDELPLDPVDESGVVVAYTDDKYQYGMESVLLRIVADIAMRDELPMDHGWIVQNTETLRNVYRALDEGEPVTRKYVHVDGNVPRHRFLEVPIGTPAADLLEAAGRSPSDLGDDEVLLDGGPGWCFEIDGGPDEFGVSKRTNCVLVLDRDVVEQNTLGGDRVNCLSAVEWSGDHETLPTSHDPESVRVPLITNPQFGEVVATSRPIVEVGDEVTTGEMVAVPGQEGISNTQHATIDGAVTAVTDEYVVIEGGDDADAAGGRVLDHDRMIYWTWCERCGAYVARPESDHLGEGTFYVCRDCRQPERTN